MNYYLSLDETVSGDDIVLASDLSTLKSSDLWDAEKATVTIPSGTTIGSYFVLFWSDAPATFTEPDQVDNLMSLQLLVGSPVALKVSDDQLGTKEIELGQIASEQEENEDLIENSIQGNLSTLLDFQAYPNPSAGAFTVSSRTIPGITSACDLRVIDVDGRIVYETIYKIGTEQLLDLTSIDANGIYHMLIQNETGMLYEQRLMIIR